MTKEQSEGLISKAVAAFRRSASANDTDVYRMLVAEGVESAVAARLVEFLPMAYCRLLLEHSGVRFSNTFRRMQGNGQMSSEKPLLSEPVWGAVLAFARDEVERGILQKDLLAIAGHSAEFDAVNQMSKKGSNLKDIALTPTLLTWPENGSGH